MRRMQFSTLYRSGSSPLLKPRIISLSHHRCIGSQAHAQQEKFVNKDQASAKNDEKSSAMKKSKKKTTAELDAELQRKMSGLSGDGGEAGVEYENGQPVAMKRSVRENMFRYI
ncbi:uncharacterized protein F4807DRAFT_172099 [Annulohypoxylon truncatum]|uniref:uncharacterized protein n=1 Tax=Annulohypoxylon truncatum TaxID=327061 RepID=UPI002007AB36|nr:uncharacterized protein F4807DRAFT_172099 [Annulohypoxylon truncatum]KAI1207591.1 hypothetical protein F4807DRAFT_172099 [Annulohypoxylon truncatum]